MRRLILLATPVLLCAVMTINSLGAQIPSYNQNHSVSPAAAAQASLFPTADYAIASTSSRAKKSSGFMSVFIPVLIVLVFVEPFYILLHKKK